MSIESQRRSPNDACAVRTIRPERVEAARESLLDVSDAESLANRFKVLADPGRLAIINALLEVGEMCVCDLAAVAGDSGSATSH